MTPQQLTEEYIFAHDLREASAKIYRAATKALLKHFGVLDQGYSHIDACRSLGVVIRPCAVG